jgi:hypothetical protein
MTAVPTTAPSGRRTLWAAPWWISPGQLRAACMLPPAARLAPAAVLVVWLLVLPSLPPEAIPPGLAVFFGLLVLAVVLLRRYGAARRWQVGMVRLTPAEFDLVCTLGQLPPARVAEGRELQNAYVRAMWEARGPDATTAVLEQRMRALVAAAATA